MERKKLDARISECLDLLAMDDTGGWDRKEVLRELESLARIELELVKFADESKDKEDRRLFDKVDKVTKNENQKFESRIRFACEIVKALSALSVLALSIFAHRSELGEILSFEETGRINSKPGREFRLFKF